jgi:hypothetical protein
MMEKLLLGLSIFVGLVLDCTATLPEGHKSFAHRIAERAGHIDTSGLPNPEKARMLAALSDRVVDEINKKAKMGKQRQKQRDAHCATGKKLELLYNKIQGLLKKYSKDA